MARTAFVVATVLLSGVALGDSAHFQRLSVQDGLSASSVESIAEDRFGFLWFGTQEGLNRFDGYEFDAYHASSEPGRLHDGFIRAVVPDPNGNLWVGTSTGLQHLDVATLRFSGSITPPGVGVVLNTIRVAPDGRVWFAGSAGGLWTREPGGEGDATIVATDLIDPTTVVTALAQSPDGHLIVAADGRLLHLAVSNDAGRSVVTLLEVTSGVGRVSALLVEDDAVWVGSRQAPLTRVDLRDGSRTVYSHLPSHLLTIVPAAEGRLWLGGKGAGVTRFDPSTGETIVYRHEPGNEDSIAEDDVAVIHRDRGGNLWAGAWNGGLSRLDLYSQAFRTLRFTPGQANSLPDNDVTRMAEGPDGRLWMITRNDVLAAGDPVSEEFVTYPIEGSLSAIAFAGTELFVGTKTGLVQLDPTSARVVSMRADLRSAELDRLPIGALAARSDVLWILGGESIHRMGKKGMERVQLPGECSPVSMFPSSDTELWIACERGMLLYVASEAEGMTVDRVGDREFSERGRLSFITEDAGTFWIGSARGIGRMDPRDGTVEWIGLDRGSTSRSIASIVPDPTGVLWIATERGIIRYDPDTGEAIAFGEVQGAQGSGYVEGGAVRGASGRIYLAGKGITVFDPGQVTSNPYPPQVVLSSLEILHRSVRPAWTDPASPLSTALHAADELTLAHDDVVFSIEMAAPGASDPAGIRFAHRLDGFDEEWIETGAERRVATYTRLDPGEYVLRARARSSSGRWSSDEASLRMRILPPWWQTPAAIALWIALGALLIVLIVFEERRRTRIRVALAEKDILRRTSVTDPLTGLYNRRFLAEWLKGEIPTILRSYRADATKPRETILLVAADLDNLKEINDRFGHDKGDQAIRVVAEVLASHARAGDLAVRLGGDEFLLVLRSVERSRAVRIVERLRSSVESLGLSPGEGTRPTISLGFSSFPFFESSPEVLSWDQTLRLADRALLHSKRRGRNVWTGFVATDTTSPTAVVEYLETGGVGSPNEVLQVVDGPIESAPEESDHRVDGVTELVP